MAKYRRKFEHLSNGMAYREVKAFRFNNDDTSYALLDWLNQELHKSQVERLAQWVNDELRIPLQDGWFTLRSGDWLVETAYGEIFPYECFLFNSIYEPVPEDSLAPTLTAASAELEATREALINSIYAGADHIIESAQTLRANTDWAKSVELDILAFDAAKLKAWAQYIFRERTGNGQ